MAFAGALNVLFHTVLWTAGDWLLQPECLWPPFFCEIFVNIHSEGDKGLQLYK